MGADLIVEVLELRNGIEPDFEAARKFVADMADGDCAVAMAKRKQWSSAELTEAQATGVEAFRKELLDACAAVEAMWREEWRTAVRVWGYSAQMLVAGDTSWGDPVEACEHIQAFYSCGAAHAAGFTTHGDWTVCGYYPDNGQRFCEHVSAPGAKVAERAIRAGWPEVSVVAVFPGKLTPADDDPVVSGEGE